MKEVPENIKNVFLAVRTLVEGNIANAQFAEPLDVEKLKVKSVKDANEIIRKKYDAFSHPRVYLAQFWIVLVILMIEESKACYDQNNIHAFVRPVLNAVIIATLVIIYEMLVGQLPFQHTVDKLLLTTQENKQKQLVSAFCQARQEADNKGPLSSWRFFRPDPTLEQLFEAHTIPVMIHESILRALSSLTYNAFDCIGASGLMLLKLIENKCPHEIQWYYKPGSDFDGHNFIVVKTDNNERIINDVWYDVCINESDAYSDPNFLLRYPLYDPADKNKMTSIQPDQHKYYKNYIEMFNKALENKSHTKVFSV